MSGRADSSRWRGSRVPADVEQLLREHAFLKEQQYPWLQDWQDIADLMMPGQSDILTLRQPGNTRTRQLFDSTALWALDTFVSHLGAWVTNFQMRWFSLRMRALREDQDAARWLDEVAQIQYEEMIADDASVATAVHEAYRMYGGFGTGALYLDEQPMDERPTGGFRGYAAESLPIARYVVAENAGGRVDTLYRDLELTPHQAAQYWGVEALHQDMQEALRPDAGDARRFQPQLFVQAIYPRRDRDRSRADQAQMPWASVWIDKQHRHTVREGGYRWFPCMVYRWEKLIPHNPYGFGRGHLVLPEAKTLQLIDKDALRALPLSILPPGWLIGEGRDTVGRVSLLPGAMNPLAKGGNFVPYTSGQRWDIAQLQIEERRGRILRAFFIDQLQFLPPAEQRTHRTLGELQLRQRQMTRIMGPAFMRLLAEFLNPFIDVSFALLLHAGEFPDPPMSVIDAAMQNQGEINVEYLGPLARAQKDDEVDAILEGAEFLLNVAQQAQDPLIIQNISLDETIAHFLRQRGFPEKLITDTRVMQEARAEALRQAQQQAQHAELQGMAQAAGDAAPMAREIREFANA